MENITSLFLAICPSGIKADMKEVEKNTWSEDGNKNSNCGKKWNEQVHEIWQETKSLKKFRHKSLEKERNTAKSRRVQWMW